MFENVNIFSLLSSNWLAGQVYPTSRELLTTVPKQLKVYEYFRTRTAYDGVKYQRRDGSLDDAQVI